MLLLIWENEFYSSVKVSVKGKGDGDGFELKSEQVEKVRGIDFLFHGLFIVSG